MWLLLVVLLLSANIASADIATGLISCWGFNEGTGGAGATTADTSGTNTCTLGSGSAFPTWVSGITGAFALDFNGTESDQVNCGNGTSLSPGGNAMTIALRVNTDSATTTQNLLAKTIPNTSTQYSVQWRSTQRIRASIKTGGAFVETNTNLNAATNYSFVVVYNATDIRSYVNGVLDSTPVSSTGNLSADNGNPVLIGLSSNTTPLAFSGVMDDVRIWSRALTAGDANEYHTDTGGCAAAAPTVTRRRNVVY